MNGGMYQTDNTPLGLYIENGQTITPVNNRTATGNFYLKPNGILSIDDKGTAAITPTEKFGTLVHIQWATQSGPMLVSDGKMHAEFKANSVNTNIRNGVDILPDGQLLFVMSKKPVNFYAFASYFTSADCRQALYLDGFVSRTYLPASNWIQTDGNFGVMIGETVAK